MVRQLSAATDWVQTGHITASGVCARVSQAAELLTFSASGGTFALLKSFFPAKCGVTTTFVDITKPDEVAAAITNRTKVDLLRAYAVGG